MSFKNRKIILVALIMASIHAATPLAKAMDIERANFKITVPEGCTVDPESQDFDLDHYVSINLPNDNFLLIMVVDDQEKTEAVFNATLDNYKESLHFTKKTKGHLLDKFKGTSIKADCKVSGLKYILEMGWMNKSEKGFVFVTGYLKEEEKSFSKSIKKIIDSFEEKKTKEEK